MTGSEALATSDFMDATFLSDDEIRALPRLAKPTRGIRLARWTLYGRRGWRDPSAWNAQLWYARDWDGAWLCDVRGRFTQPRLVNHASLIRVNPDFEPYRNRYFEGKPSVWLRRYAPRPEATWETSASTSFSELTPLVRVWGWNPMEILLPIQGAGHRIVRAFVLRAFQAAQRDTLTYNELL